VPADAARAGSPRYDSYSMLLLLSKFVPAPASAATAASEAAGEIDARRAALLPLVRACGSHHEKATCA